MFKLRKIRKIHRIMIKNHQRRLSGQELKELSRIYMKNNKISLIKDQSASTSKQIRN